MAHQWRGLIEEYRERLPVSAATPVITLREGGTPLVYACVLSELVGCEVWLKYDGANPTGSFKDRGMTMAISKAAEAGAKAVICAIDRQHVGERGGLRGQGRHDVRGARPPGQDRHGQAGPGDRARRPAPPGRGQLRRLP
jgi:hypothetical protein